MKENPKKGNGHDDSLKTEGITKWSSSSKISGGVAHQVLGSYIEREFSKKECVKEYKNNEDNLNENYKWIYEQYPTLKDSVSTFLEKNGEDTSTIHWIQIENILPKYNSHPLKHVGNWDNFTEIIKLYPIKFHQKLNIEKRKSIVKHILIHELFHSVSRNSIFVSIEDSNEWPFMRASKSGLESRVAVSKENLQNCSMGLYFQAFNEGITELMTTMTSPNKDIEAYRNEVDLVTIIMGSIVNGSITPTKHNKMIREQESDRVFKLLIHTYMHNWSPEFKQELRENFGKGALSLLSFLEVGDLDEPKINQLVQSFFSVTRHNLIADEQEDMANNIRFVVGANRAKQASPESDSR